MKALLKIAFLFLFSLLISNNLFGQSTSEDVIYLKNGWIIRGDIIEFIPEKHVKIESAGRNVFVFTIDEIEKVSKEEVKKEELAIKESNEDSDAFNVKGRGSFAYIGELGTAIYLKNAEPMFSIENLVGGRITDVFTMGIKFGIDINGKIGYAPIGLGMRIDLLKGKRGCPFIDIGGGYGQFIGKGNVSTGMNSSMAIGGKFWISSKVAVSMKTGYQGMYSIESKSKTNHAFTFKAGFEF